MKQITSFFVLSALTLLCFGQVKSTTKGDANHQNSTGKAKITNPEKNTPWPYKQSVDCSIQDKNGDIWFGTTDGLYRYDGHLFTNYKAIDGIGVTGIIRMIEDKAGNIWFGATGGVVCYNTLSNKGKKGPSFTTIKFATPFSKLNFAASLNENMYGNDGPAFVGHLLEDDKGTIWFTVGYELHYIDKGTDFAQCTGLGAYLKSEKIKLSTGYPDDFGIRSLCKDLQGNILISAVSCGCCYSVTYKIKAEQLRNACFRNTCHHQTGDAKELENHNKGITSSLKKITLDNADFAFGSAHTDKHGKMWFGAAEKGGVYHYDGDRFVKGLKNEELDKFAIAAIVEDSKGNIWFGTYANSNFVGSGVFKYNPSGKGASAIKHYTKKDGLCSNHPFSNDVITSINEDKNGRIWFGGDAGICYLTADANKSGIGNFINFGKGEGMNDDHANFILTSRSGEMWFGTWNLGVYKYDGKRLVSYND